MHFDWDAQKDRQNQRKHDGISFDLAMRIFNDHRCVIDLDIVDETGEQRWYALGSCDANAPAVLFVIHVYREDSNGEEIIRIISARQANKQELRRYQEQTVN